MGDWGKKIKVVFADAGGGAELHDVKSSELTSVFRLREDTYMTYLYPSSVTIGEMPNEIILNFQDFNQSPPPWTLQYLGGTSLRGKDLPVDAFDMPIDLKNLNRHGDYEYVKITDISVSGLIDIAFDGKLYADPVGHVVLSNISVAGTNITFVFEKAYANQIGCVKIANIAVAGQYADINGIPL